MKAKNKSRLSILIKILAIIFLIAALVVVYALIVKPWYSKWSTIEHERNIALLGDDIVIKTNWEYTHENIQVILWLLLFFNWLTLLLAF